MPLRRRFAPWMFCCAIALELAPSFASPAVAADANEATPSATSKKPGELDVVYVATPPSIVTRMLELAQVGKRDVVYDLGCGDGRIVIEAARRHGCRGVGYDLDAERIRESKANATKANVATLVTFEQKDIFQADFADASVVMLYLAPQLNARLVPQLDKLPPGTRVVSHLWEIPGVRPERVVTIDSPEEGRHELFFFTTPLKKTPAKP